MLTPTETEDGQSVFIILCKEEWLYVYIKSDSVTAITDVTDQVAKTFYQQQLAAKLFYRIQ
jgi:hypothetical protein